MRYNNSLTFITIQYFSFFQLYYLIHLIYIFLAINTRTNDLGTNSRIITELTGEYNINSSISSAETYIVSELGNETYIVSELGNDVNAVNTFFIMRLFY